MAAWIFRLLLCLYPADYRMLLGSEMLAVYQRSLTDALQKSAAGRIAFFVREFGGLLSGALREQRRTSNSVRKPWLWSLEAPLAALLLYSACVRIATAMRIHGFFFPGTWIVVAGLGAYAAWRLGQECTLVFPPRRWLRTAGITICVTLLIPVAARITEGAWARFLMNRHTRLEYALPGLDVIIERQGQVPQLRTQGLTFSSTTVLSDGTVMCMFNHVEGPTPPYCLIGGLLAMGISLCSRRRMAWNQT